MNYVSGGRIEKKATREDGQFTIHIANEPAPSELFHGLGASMRVLLTHGDSVTEVAPGFTVSATSEDGIVAAIENPSKQLYE